MFCLACAGSCYRLFFLVNRIDGFDRVVEALKRLRAAS